MAKPPNIQHTSFTAWTTRVSNPVCSPRFRASASETDQVAAFATGVLPNIYEFLLYTGNSTTPSALKHTSIKRSPQVEPGNFTPDLMRRLRALYAQSFRATLAPFVLPRLLARSLPGLLLRVPSPSSPPKGLYNPKTFFTHAAWLGQACAHCPIFPTAASRRSLGRVSVPVWLIILPDQLPIVALVGRYPTN